MTWYRNLYEPLLDLGVDVYLLRLDEIEQKLGAKSRTPEFRDKLSQFLLDSFKREHEKEPFHLLFAYLMDHEVHPSCIREIGRQGVITTNFSCNNIHQFYLTEQIATSFDYNLHSEKDAAGKFKAIGANSIWFPMAANPKYYYPMDVPKTMDTLFVGSYYAQRPYYLFNLLENNVDVHAYGLGWTEIKISTSARVLNGARRFKKIVQYLLQIDPCQRAQMSSHLAELDFQAKLQFLYGKHLHPPVEDEQMTETYNRARTVLGFLEVYDHHDRSGKLLQHLHLREFEVPMCGALYLTNFSEELAEFYEPDREIIVYRTVYELIDKIKYYLQNESECEKVRKAAYNRAIQCHTYQQRFYDLFSELNLVINPSTSVASCSA
jgi:spore maturation protein CgeB